MENKKILNLIDDTIHWIKILSLEDIEKDVMDKRASIEIEYYYDSIVFSVLKTKELIERLTILQKKLEQARKEGRINPVEYRNIQRYYWGRLPLHERKINQKLEYQLFNRRPVATYELREIQQLNLRDEVFAVGVGTTLELYPDEQSYHEYQKMIEQKN